MADRPLHSGLMPGDIEWLETLVTEVLAGGETRRAPQAQRVLDLLKRHGDDFRLDIEEREKKLHAEWEAWEREAQNRHCIICSAIMWTQDMSGKNNVVCMGCGRPLCITHYLVHKALESGYLSPEQQLQSMREASQRLYGTTDWQRLSIAQRASFSLEVKLPSGRHVTEKSYTIYAGEYEQHWIHRCRTPIPHKDMNVLRVEQGLLYQALVEIDKQMESAPAEETSAEETP